MRQYILATLFLGLFILFLEPAEKLLSNFLRIEQPTIHEIQDGDWLSKIAREYYGDPSYWKELQLINRAPAGNWVFPGEKVIVPSFNVIQKIRKTKKLSEVNKLVEEQRDLLANKSARYNEIPNIQEFQSGKKEPLIVSNMKPEVSKDIRRITSIEQEITKSDGEFASFSLTSTMLLASVIILCFGFLLAIYFFIRRRKNEEITYYGGEPAEDNPEEAEKSIYLDDFNEESKDRKEKEKDKEERSPVELV